jgi:hypothetical protein
MPVLKNLKLKPIHYVNLVILFVLSTFIVTKSLIAYWDENYLCKKAFTYWSLEEALKKPEVVCILHLHNDDAILSTDILKLKNLRILHLHMSHLKNVPVFLKNLPKLTELAIDGYQFEDSFKQIKAEFPGIIVVLDYSHPPHEGSHAKDAHQVEALKHNLEH